MKKLFGLALAGLSIFALASCTPEEKPLTDYVKCTSEATETSAIEIALITDVGTIDDKSFNQGAWEGVEAYAANPAGGTALVENTDYKYYKPGEKTNVAYVEAMNLAIKNGAKTIVTPGFLFEPAIYAHQSICKDINYVLIDGTPQPGDYSDFTVGEKTFSILFAEEQSGYLAGYAAVKEGKRELGFMGGMAVPAVVKFGHGFVQGAYDAAQEIDTAAGNTAASDALNIKYTYLGDFAPNASHQTKAAAWYSEGTEVIFAAAGGAGNSVMAAAADSTGKSVIGVDIDQGSLDIPNASTVITSAMKNLATAVEGALRVIYDHNHKDTTTYKPGETITLDASKGGVSLPAIDTNKFSTFNQEMYDIVHGKLVDGTITVDQYIHDNTDTAADTEKTTLSALRYVTWIS